MATGAGSKLPTLGRHLMFLLLLRVLCSLVAGPEFAHGFTTNEFANTVTVVSTESEDCPFDGHATEAVKILRQWPTCNPGSFSMFLRSVVLRDPSSSTPMTHHGRAAHDLPGPLIPPNRNLKPFLKFLPCPERAGVAALLKPHRAFEARSPTGLVWACMRAGAPTRTEDDTTADGHNDRGVTADAEMTTAG
ncbi:hypothetical protein EDB83DRAFT_2314869 [Lactarius deliciosus]|nr:hypothetical protein EDB83DRAFT_2314869 [Lactarius deliciosus]